MLQRRAGTRALHDARPRNLPLAAWHWFCRMLDSQVRRPNLKSRIFLLCFVAFAVTFTAGAIAFTTPYFSQKVEDYLAYSFKLPDWPRGPLPLAPGLADSRLQNYPGSGCDLPLQLESLFGTFDTSQWMKQLKLKLPSPCWKDQPDEWRRLDDAVTWVEADAPSHSGMRVDTDVLGDDCALVFGPARLDKKPCTDRMLLRVPYTNPITEVPGDVNVVFLCCQRNERVVYRLRPSLITRPVQREPEIPGLTTHNLYLIMIDSLSRANFYRQMPEAAAQLSEWYKNPTATPFRVFQFFRYIVVGENSAPNQKAYSSLNANLYASDFPNAGFSWDILMRKAGFVTAMMQGECRLPYDGGHPKRPWAYDPGTDVSVYHEYCPGQPSTPLQSRWKDLKSYQCLGQDTVAEVEMQHGIRFMTSHTGQPRMVTMNIQDAHERYLMKGKVLDRPLRDHLREIVHHPEFQDNTLIFLFSDHGLHYGPYARAAQAGRYEHRLPTLFVLAPHTFLDRYPEVAAALQANEQRMVTAYDLYRTWLHAAVYPDELDQHVPKSHLGQSILRELPKHRTCEQAGISAFWCPCS